MNLSGKKTYISAVAIALTSLALAFGWITKEQYEAIMGVLGALGLAALRQGVTKSGPAPCNCSPETGADYNMKAPK